MWASMCEVHGVRTRHLLAIVCAANVLTGLAEGFWPAEDTQWSAELVNTSSLCFNASVEDVNPEDPAIWQYSRAASAKPRKLSAECAQPAWGNPGRQWAVTGVTHRVTSILACGTNSGVAAAKTLSYNRKCSVIYKGDRHQAKSRSSYESTSHTWQITSRMCIL